METEKKTYTLTEFRQLLFDRMNANAEFTDTHKQILTYLINVQTKHRRPLTMKYAYIAKVLDLKFSTVQRIFREFVNSGLIEIVTDATRKTPDKYYVYQFCDWVADEYVVRYGEIPNFKRPTKKKSTD